MTDTPPADVAMLEMDGGLRMTCVGCAAYLHQQGLLVVVRDLDLPASDVPKRDAIVARVYRYAPGVTIAQCRDAIKHRHLGPDPWPA